MLAKVVASLWPDVYSNKVDPEWDPTKMGRRGAPNNLQKGCETQAWLAVANDNKAMVSGQYFYQRVIKPFDLNADNIEFQEKFLLYLRKT